MRPSALLAVAALLTAACAPTDDGGMGDAGSEADAPGVMRVVARGLTFEGPSEIPSGWTTIRFVNEADVVHFAVVERLPEGQSIVTQQEQVAPPFQEGLNLLAAGDTDAAMEAFGQVPPWFGEIVFLGGPGLTSASHVSEATVFLEPGTYLLECYVKTGGTFHSYNPDPATFGMVHQFTVTGESTDVSEPASAVRLEISAAAGIEVDGTFTSGEQTVAVRFADQTVHENFVGHDVHLVRVAGDLDLARLESWMDWRGSSGLQTPAPAEFLGGLSEMPAGAVGYFHVDLEPGRYALISEVPEAAGKGMLREFTIQ